MTEFLKQCAEKDTLTKEDRKRLVEVAEKIRNNELDYSVTIGDLAYEKDANKILQAENEKLQAELLSVNTHCTYTDTGCGDCNYTKLIGELQKYKDKLTDGRMVELPCKVGDTVYGIIVDRLQDMKKSANEQPIPFLRIADGIAESFLIRKDRVNIYFQTKSRGLPMCYSCDFNKTVFLTKPEALLKLGEGENK